MVGGLQALHSCTRVTIGYADFHVPTVTIFDDVNATHFLLILIPRFAASARTSIKM